MRRLPRRDGQALSHRGGQGDWPVARRVPGSPARPMVDGQAPRTYHGHAFVATESNMRTAVGVRKLRDGLTRYLERVRRGARLVITDRGRPVALLLPYREGTKATVEDWLAAFFASGHVSPAERRFLANPPLARGRGRSLAAIVREDRRRSTPTRPSS